MQITLNSEEISEAVESYVRSQINIADGQEIDIDFKAGRGDNGMTATLDIRPARPNKKKFTRTTAKPAPAPAPEPEEEAASAPAEEAVETADIKPETVQESDTPDETASEEAAPKPSAAEKPGSIFNFAQK